MEDKTIDILGTTWIVEFKDYDPGFEAGQGFCCECEKRIVIENVKKSDDPLAASIEGQKINQKRVIRHEIVHAYLSECGLDLDSAAADHWATNEEMVDWIARLGPKIHNTWKELGVL